MTELEFMREIGDNIRNELEDSWMTQRELSEETYIVKSTISKYVNGTLMPSLKNIVNIARVLDCDINDLIPTYETIE